MNIVCRVLRTAVGWFPRLILMVMPLLSCSGTRFEEIALSPSPIGKSSGPELAKGAVVWLPGWSRWEKTFAQHSVRVPSIFSEMSPHGWDVFHATTPDRAWRPFEYADTILIIDTIKRLKASGYKKVILAGQSSGAWLALSAGTKDSEADGIVLMAPANFGEFNTSNSTELIKIFKDWRVVPTIFYNPSKDAFNPVLDRGVLADAILTKRNIPHLIIDKPEGISGHASGQTWRFAYFFQKCFEDFLGTGANVRLDCKAADISPKDTRWMANETEILSSGAKLESVDPLSAALKEKDLIWYGGNADWRIRFQQDHKIRVDYLPISSADYLKEVLLDWHLEGDNRFCFELPTSPTSQKVCWKIYSSDDGLMHIVAERGIIVGRVRL